ncbi:MAG TPA: Tudor-knot domain-containing protein [Chthoniobacteraceae bacterium]|jgi:hypothetical protein|nr:Tudor-knot domain-containing protein [Chthoniobacteraceae bacterium]
MHLRALLLWLVVAVSASAEAPAWQPRKTWVFAVGILTFEGARLHGWPEKGRMDEVMLDAMRQRGVAADHIVFLKNEQATLAQLRAGLATFVRRAGANDTLIFYYAGHGGRDYQDAARPVHLVPYDSSGSWQTKEVLDTIDSGFKGTCVLLTADCCHSGGLAEEAARHQGRISYGTLTSARSSATSTGNWTFTQCLADLYRGQPALDLDHDGAITFAEAAQYCDLKMAFHENQRATNAATAGFPRDFVFAPVAGPAARVGETCEARWQGKWYQAEILAAHDGKYQVTWPGWDKSYDSWVAPEDLRPAPQTGFADGAKLEIEWRTKWYPGAVVQSALGLLLVHYDGFGKTDDEWVPLPRVRQMK